MIDIDQTVLPRLLRDEVGKSAAVRLADGNNGLIAHSVFGTEPDDGRFGRMVDGRRPEHEVGPVEPIGQTAAGNQNPLERRDEVRLAPNIGGVHGGIEKTLSLRLDDGKNPRRET